MNNKSFEKFYSELNETNRGYNFFVDWDVIDNNFEELKFKCKIFFSQINSLIGRSGLEKEIFKIIDKNNELIDVILILIAVRIEKEKNKTLTVLTDMSNSPWKSKEYNFKLKKNEKLSKERIEDIIELLDKTGIINLLEDNKISNVESYVYGVEVGMDTNGRKNRSGKFFEQLITKHLIDLQKRINFEFMTQATNKKIKSEWNIKLSDNATGAKRYDYAIKLKDKIIIIETNFYSSQGSKPTATSGQYETMQRKLLTDDKIVEFIWITDGSGWKKANNEIRNAFEQIDNLYNYTDVENGALENIILKYSEDDKDE